MQSFRKSHSISKLFKLSNKKENLYEKCDKQMKGTLFCFGNQTLF